MLSGLIIRLQAGFYTVHTEQGEITCRLRGRIKQDQSNQDLVAVGDRVRISLLPDGSGVIEDVKEREHSFFRLAPSARGDYKQILLANLDQMLLVFACAHPAPSFGMLDRFLVIMEKQRIATTIVANKVDLVGVEKARDLFKVYQDLGYPVLFTSAETGLNIAQLENMLVGKVSAFSGPSGVGKSSLLNQIQPQLGLRIGGLKNSSKKGKHTTVVRQLFPIKNGGFIGDMPGLRSLALWDTEPEELDGYFPELRDLVVDCQFNDCSHITEPNCAVKQAVKDGRVHPDRYASYVRLRMGDEDE